MGYYSLQLCAGGGAFEAIPDPRLSLDLAKARATLAAHSVPVVDARVMLIVQLRPELTLSRDGRVVIKTRDRDEAAATFERLREMLGLPGTGATRGGSATGARTSPPDNRYGRRAGTAQEAPR